MSTPHFYQGSQNLLDAVEGIEPIKEEHETHIDLEPVRIFNRNSLKSRIFSFTISLNKIKFLSHLSDPVCSNFRLQKDPAERGREKIQSS